MTSKQISLDDKYTLDHGRMFMTGIQALVRLPVVQKRRDRDSGLNTAGFVAGYRGSPLGALDQQFTRAGAHLIAHDVHFRPAVNEDLAATSVWGTQQAELDGEGLYDGVFAMWYGKGPGVDRSGDALRHANLAGVSAFGGVLALMGDDHACESSTTAHQSEFAFVDAMIPILNPAGVQEILDYGQYGWALSRFSGCWVGLKCVHDTVEATASVDLGAQRVTVTMPGDYEPPAGGLNIRWPDSPQEQELRLHRHKLQAAQAFVRVNRLDRIVLDSNRARVGVITTGKSYLDVRQALLELNIDEREAERIGLRLYKVALTWPLEPDGALRFSQGLNRIVVVEEKRGLIEDQLKTLLYGQSEAPPITGKRGADGQLLFPSWGRLESNHIARVLGQTLLEECEDARLTARVQRLLSALDDLPVLGAASMKRTPYFCAGCPHNTSTVVPDGSHAYAGIGCHWLAQFMGRNVARYTHMGGEGSNWVGEALFSKRPHVFQAIGDGTYYHSGSLAIRAAVASGVNITFKILYNDAVAMTGGQKPDGPLSVPIVSRQMAAEGVRRIVVVTDEPRKYGRAPGFAPGVSVRHRDELDAVQRELRETAGTTVLIYDQTCAAEKRRRRKRGQLTDPPKRLFINELVCEGCGDCGRKSNCVAILPLETELGRKRQIDQSACNKDYSCIKGLCPSFVTVRGGRLRQGSTSGKGLDEELLRLPEPEFPSLDSYAIVIAGVGGSGVITIGALLASAAHLDGKGCSVLDMTGLAQKGGAVISHVILSADPAAVTTMHVARGGADLILGCDLVVTSDERTLATAARDHTRAIVNTHPLMTGDFTRDPDREFPQQQLIERIGQFLGDVGSLHAFDASEIAVTALGDNLGANLLILGCALQMGLLPLSAAAIEQAIELNGQAVAMNTQAFRLGRLVAADPKRVQELLVSRSTVSYVATEDVPLGGLLDRHATYLSAYQNASYAQRYRLLVERVRDLENTCFPAKQSLSLSETVARGYFKLLAYKDEYEVARLYTNGEFERRLREQFEGDFRCQLNLAPPLFARRDATSGEPRKREFGPWIFTVLRWIARLKGLRGTFLDPFGRLPDRRLERRLIAEYEDDIEEVLGCLDADNYDTAVELCGLPNLIRGFGQVKARTAAEAAQRRLALRRQLHHPGNRERAA